MGARSPGRPETVAERAWIASLRERVTASRESTGMARSLQLGIGDDCAILRPPPGHRVLVTTDFSLETVHFRRDWHTPESVGHRCLARGLSDIAAMGGQPLAAFLSLALPPELAKLRRGQPSWRDRFLAGLLALAGRHGVPLAGGDTARSPQMPLRAGATGLALADIVLVGSVPRRRALLRSGARPGDRLYVTGHLGGAAAELNRLATRPRRFRGRTQPDPAVPNPHPHLFPQPRLAVGAWLLGNRRATAAIDSSDGLSTDLDHICQESAVSAVVQAAALPLHPLVLQASAAESLRFALHGGEDYELLFTASPKMRVPPSIAGVPIACIGHVRKPMHGQPRMVLVEQGRERPLLAAGWEH